MLIRVRGGNAGVFRYLRDGKKSGRDYSRDELDERVVLAGDMSLAESVVEAMGGRGEKYLHITLAFKEDALPVETLRAITEDFQHFCMSAFRPNEFSFYAEAHLPRIKSYTNRKTGQQVVRKPHIHIVIPELNLLSHKTLNPLGKVDYQTKYLEAFQEHINDKYGLASPRDNRRIAFTDESTLLSRQKGDDFQGIGGDLKRQLLDAMLERVIEDFDSFEWLVAEFGAVRRRNEGKPNAYLNVRPEGTRKGVNLKDYIFSPVFVALPVSEKKKYLAAESERRADEAAEYVEAKSQHLSPAEITDRLAEWHEIRARELKYMNSGSKARYAAYKAADPEGKKSILDQRETAFYEKHDHEGADAELQDVLLDELEFADAGEPAAATEVEALPNREPESVIEQLFVEHKKDEIEAALASSSEYTEIKLSLDATLLLARLSHTHGVIPEKHLVTKGSDGGDRIQCGTRKLNVADFLTKELHLPWPEAQNILREAYAAQKAKAVAKPRGEILEHLWNTYRDTWPARKTEKEKDLAAQKWSEAQRRAVIKTEYLRERAAIKADLDKSPVDRKAAYSINSMWRTMESAKLSKKIRLERQALRAKHPQPGKEGYRVFLVALVHDCNSTALAELWRQSRPRVQQLMGAVFSGDERDLSKPVILPLVSYRVDTSGNVTYYADNAKTRPILRDTGLEVQVYDHALESVEIGLRLAIQKFGRELKVNGSHEFKRQVLAVVLKTRLPVSFKEPVMAGALEQLKARAAQSVAAPFKTEQEIEAEFAAESQYEHEHEHEHELDAYEPMRDTDYIENDHKPAPRGGPRMG